MGRSSAPFIYDRQSTYSFSGPTDRPFNPKAVTQASWTPRPPRPQPNGPLVNFNRHPDSYTSIPDGVSKWTPMSPYTKSKVKYARIVQYILRVLALIGALGSLFCAVVVKGAAVIIWIIRAAPIVAILHTLYGVYHLCRSPVRRPAGSQASYWIFAATLDLGLIPFYVFSAYIAYGQYTAGSYNWDTLFDVDGITEKISESLFLLSVVNGGLHLISFGISVWLATIFREIRRLPPDLNPLEDNLTARPHKRNKSELTEKYLSQSSFDSGIGMEDPLMGPPRNVPFMHTRGMSSGGGSHSSWENYQDKQQPPVLDVPPVPPVPRHDYLPSAEPPKPEVRFRQLANQSNVQLSPLPVTALNNVLARPTSAVIQNDQDWDPSPPVPVHERSVTPASDNWIAYQSRSPSPAPPYAEEAPSPVEETQPEKRARRESSPMFTRSNTSASTNSTFRNWLNYSQRYAREVSGPIAEENRGEYESLATHEYYGNEETTHNVPQQHTFYDNPNTEQDLGDHRINIHLDHDDDEQDPSHDTRVNPLGMNPPTPQPLDNPAENAPAPTAAAGRVVLTDIPNLTPTPPKQRKQHRFYDDLESKTGLSVPRYISDTTKTQKRQKSKLVKSASQKLKAYTGLKQHDDSDDQTDPATTEGDQKGRVISNSGADIAAQRSMGLGSSLSYGNYIAELGVGRRRDVSGKIAEEGRGGSGTDENNSAAQNTTPRAAGWARFAGL